jgi:Restriction endonuclease XhoI
MLTERSIKLGISSAIQSFWKTREGQAKRQEHAGRSDQGSRGAVTGGKQMNGFVALVHKIIQAAGLSEKCIHTSQSLELPGYFRPEKKWDLIVIDHNVLVAAIEFKSQTGPSFGNNFNNRSEEAIGSAQDIWTAYREGAFSLSERPWLGFLMMLEDCPQSTSPVAIRQPHFPVFPEFHEASYSLRYQLLLTKLVRERLYDSTCFLLSSRKTGATGKYLIPNPNLSFLQFASSLTGKITTHLNAK